MLTDKAEQHDITTADAARALAQTAIECLDLDILKPHVLAILSEGNKAALSAMAVSGEEPDLLDQFLVLCEPKDLLTEAECDHFSDAYLEAVRTRAA